MKCPYCNHELEKGKLESNGSITLKVNEESFELSKLSFVDTLVSNMTNVEVQYCPACHKAIIDLKK